MQDRGKVVKGLKCCSNYVCLNNCPYKDAECTTFECTSALANDALALLQQLENDIHHMGLIIDDYAKQFDKHQEIVRCKDCIYYDQGDERHIYNPGTGSCIIQGVYCVDNWFCAGGERR